MDERLIDVDDLRAVFRKVGIKPEEYNRCTIWTSNKLEQPLAHEDTVLAELSLEEQHFLHCMGYVFEQKVVDSRRARALYETFWTAVRSLHDLPQTDLAVKEGRYIVAV